MRIAGFLLAVAMIPLLLSCGGKSALPPVADTVPLILAPVSKTKTADAREGVGAFLARRKPAFTGK
jgi:enoyl-CoA hydratase/carnithine racemase